MNRTMLRNYARLAVRVGVNVQKGQPVIVYADVDQAELVTLIVEEAYRAGACWVRVEWGWDPLVKLNYRYRGVKSLSEIPAWQEAKFKELTERLPCAIHLESSDPDGLRGINRKKMQQVQQNRYRKLKQYYDAMENKYQWTILAAPSDAWARKVFPGQRTSTARGKLFDAIFQTVHMTPGCDPVAVWEEVNRKFTRRCQILNGYRFARMEYKSANGTDFCAELIPQARWAGGGETALNGNFFNPNLPTEEIFTSPMKGKAEGVLVATKPLSYQGQLIEDFRIEFEQGRAVRWTAEKGQDLLEKMITCDEGAAMLGELALVPCSSPIARSGILFYNTLFDENASCHVALGRGFSNLIEGYENMTKEETDGLGINDSMIHVDFMVGCEDLDIIGIQADGTRIPVFQKGEWAF